MPQGFLLAEDAAIKTQFANIKVYDDRNATRPVKVYFRYPENETEREYPFITIELMDISHARARQHSEVQLYASTSNAASAQYVGPNKLEYVPSETVDFTTYAGDGPLVSTTDYIPVDLLYQVSTFTRSALHDRQLTSQILSRAARFRWGYISIPEDGTVRRFDLLDWATSDLLDPEAGYRKRIFRKVYTIQMNAELTVTDLTSAQRVATVNTDIIDTDYQTTETVIVSQ